MAQVAAACTRSLQGRQRPVAVGNAPFEPIDLIISKGHESGITLCFRQASVVLQTKANEQVKVTVIAREERQLLDELRLDRLLDEREQRFDLRGHVGVAVLLDQGGVPGMWVRLA